MVQRAVCSSLGHVFFCILLLNGAKYDIKISCIQIIWAGANFHFCSVPLSPPFLGTENRPDQPSSFSLSVDFLWLWLSPGGTDRSPGGATVWCSGGETVWWLGGATVWFSGGATARFPGGATVWCPGGVTVWFPGGRTCWFPGGGTAVFPGCTTVRLWGGTKNWFAAGVPCGTI